MAGIDMQLKIRQNAEELGEFMKDLERWETDIKKKDNELKSSKAFITKDLPPVRNQRRKKKTKPKEERPSRTVKGTKRISSYDYESWDSYDVDEEIKKLDEKEEMETLSSSEEESNDEEQIEEERRLQRALLEKDKGNDLFKEGKFEEAINCYTTAFQLDSSNAVIPANRAMALLRVERFGAAEEDCNTALALDRSYTKAYLRRGAARAHLNKLKESLADYEEALKLEPENKQAKQEIIKLKKKLGDKEIAAFETNSENIKEVKQKKPFKRIQIDEIGSDSSEEEDEKGHLGKTGSNNAEKYFDESNTEVKDKQTKLKQNTRKITEITTSGEEEISNVKPEQQVKQMKPREETKASISALSAKNIAIINKAFDVPKNSMQLEKDWKILKNKPDQLFEYFKKINPKSYPRLFQQCIDSDMLSAIITILHDFYLPEKLPVFNELEYLAQVQRFGMTAMFLSANDKKALQSLFTSIKDNMDDNKCPGESQLNALMKKYCL